MQKVDNKDILDHISNWIQYVIETKTSNNWPICPYARKALVRQRLQVYYYDSTKTEAITESFRNDPEDFKVWVLIVNTGNFIQETSILNQKYNDIVWLYDTADMSGNIDGVNTGNKKYNLILMQNRKELNDMSGNLKQLGYYSNWATEYYDQIVSWRNNDQN